MKIKVIAIAVWLLFTISLALWWLVFGLGQLELLKNLEGSEKLISQQRMLLWEGISLVISILLGGGSLAYLAFKERRERKRIEEFFSVFSHELKTPLANIQLQAESLGAEKLIESTQRLLIHLDNAMFVAKLPEKFFFEEIDLNSFITGLANRWGSLKIVVHGRSIAEVDKRILEAVFQNLLSNSVIHGGASIVDVEILETDNNVKIAIKDNGVGFKGDYRNLGRKFYRFDQKSGSGLGLFIVKQLLKKLNGQISFRESKQGFIAEIILPKNINRIDFK